MDLQKFGVKEVADFTLFNLTTGSPELYLDTLKMSNVENTAQTVSARGGKGNPKLMSWDFEKEVNVAIQDALMSSKSIALLSGTNIDTTAKDISRREAGLVVYDDTATGTVTEYLVDVSQPIVGTASDVYVFDKNNNEIAVASISGNTVSLDSTDPNLPALGDTVTVYYSFNASTNVETISVKSDQFPGYFKAVGDTVIRDENGNDIPYQIVIHKVKLQPGYSMNFQSDGDPSVFDMNLEVFPAGEDGTSMIDLIKYEI